MTSADNAITDDDLAAIEQRAAAATPGPWHVRLLDDSHAAGLIAVSTTPNTGQGERWPDFAASAMVAATLVQFPNRYIDCADQRWDENATFIAHARQDIPRLAAEIRRLKTQLDQTQPDG